MANQWGHGWAFAAAATGMVTGVASGVVVSAEPTSLAVSPASSLPASSSPVRFVVDCGAPASPPLSKRLLGVYQTPFWFKTHSPASHDLGPLLKEAGVHDLRYELAWGKPDVYAPAMVGGTAGALRVDASPIVPFLQQLAAADVSPLLVLGYDPVPLQRSPADWQHWKDVPGDMAAWAAACGQFAARVQSVRGIGTVSYEVWNEPDLPGDGGKVFFNGSPADYGLLYQATEDALHAATQHQARVGGPAVAYDTRYITESGLLRRPIDFISVHAYANAASQLAAVRKAMGNRSVPLELTEYASFPTSALAANTHFAAASAFFSDVEHLLAEPGLQKVYWAQWVDQSMGMLSDDLHRRALFNAYEIYQVLLPTDRLSVTTTEGISSNDVHAMAAADAHTVGVVLWNTGQDDRDVAVDFQHCPFPTAAIEMFRVDAHHGSYEDDPQHERLEPSEERSISQISGAHWTSRLPAGGVIYFRIRAS